MSPSFIWLPLSYGIATGLGITLFLFAGLWFFAGLVRAVIKFATIREKPQPSRIGRGFATLALAIITASTSMSYCSLYGLAFDSFNRQNSAATHDLAYLTARSEFIDANTTTAHWFATTLIMLTCLIFVASLPRLAPRFNRLRVAITQQAERKNNEAQ